MSMSNYPLTVDFYSHNFLDINTFYFQCPQCSFKNFRSVSNFGLRVTSTIQKVSCGHCGKPIYFMVDQITLTFMVKFFPEHPITKEIVVGEHFVNSYETPDQVKVDTYNIFSKHVELVKIMESS